MISMWKDYQKTFLLEVLRGMESQGLKKLFKWAIELNLLLKGKVIYRNKFNVLKIDFMKMDDLLFASQLDLFQYSELRCYIQIHLWSRCLFSARYQMYRIRHDSYRRLITETNSVKSYKALWGRRLGVAYRLVGCTQRLEKRFQIKEIMLMGTGDIECTLMFTQPHYSVRSGLRCLVRTE